MATNEQIAAAVAPVADSIAANIPNLGDFHPSWYCVGKKANNAKTKKVAAEISIYDEIGAYGITAKQFVDDLKEIDADEIHLRLNTPGGDVFDGTAIHNALAAHPAQIIVHIDGVAASAGSFIAMSGNEIRIADNAYLMIHNAQGGVIGEASDMRHYAEILEMVSDTIASMYEKRAGKSKKHWRALMDAETWFTADEAIAAGLADIVDEPPAKHPAAPKASFDFTVYNKIPDPVRRIWGLPTNQNNAPEVSPRGEVPPDITKETPIMADSPIVTPAPVPVVVETIVASAQPETTQQEKDRIREATAQGYIEQGRKLGAKDEAERQFARLDSILATCPGKPQMALNAYRTGQSADAVKLAFEAATQAEASSAARIAQLEIENLRKEHLLAVGGHPGVGIVFADSDDATMDPKIQAEQEWDRNPGKRKGFSTKDRYVNFRMAELSGKFRGSAMAQQQA